MPHYTQHKPKGAQYYVCVGVTSDYASHNSLITHITSLRALNTMYALMSYKIALLKECLITHLTNIRALATMFALVFHQNTLLTKCLITHTTSLRALTTMYA